jgi:serine protease Do
MKKYFLKISGLAAIVVLISLSGFTQGDQDANNQKVKKDKLGENDEIIIKIKGGKDNKVVVETKDGQVWVNGKPISEVEDDHITIRRKNMNIIEDDGDAMELLEPAMPRSPFRGGVWNYNNGDELINGSPSRTALLGVRSEKTEGGGASISEVTKGSAADKIGLKKGDVILKIDEIKIEGQDDLVAAIHKYKPQDKVVVTYKRDGKELKSTAILGRTRGMDNANFNYRFEGPDMQNFKLGLPPNGYGVLWNGGRPRLGIRAQDTEDGKGVKVLDVDGESPAEKAGIKEGDIITQFEGKEVNSAETLANLSRENKTKYTLKVKLNRDGKSEDVEVKIPRKLKTANL